MQKEGLKGPAGKDSTTRMPSCSPFPTPCPSTGHRVCKSSRGKSYFYGTSFQPVLPSCLVCLCAHVFSSLFLPCLCGARGSELEESRSGHWTEKRDLGLPRPVYFLLKSGLDSVGWPLSFNLGRPPETPSLSSSLQSMGVLFQITFPYTAGWSKEGLLVWEAGAWDSGIIHSISASPFLPMVPSSEGARFIR